MLPKSHDSFNGCKNHLHHQHFGHEGLEVKIRFFSVFPSIILDFSAAQL